MQRNINLIDLVKSFPTSIWLRKSASIQPRTIPVSLPAQNIKIRQVGLPFVLGYFACFLYFHFGICENLYQVRGAGGRRRLLHRHRALVGARHPGPTVLARDRWSFCRCHDHLRLNASQLLQGSDSKMNDTRSSHGNSNS